MAEYLASQVIKVAISQIGTTETDNNNVKYNTWFYGHEVNGSKYPWCQVFVDWCFYTAYGQAGASQLLCGKSKEASTMSQKDAFSSAGRIVKKPEPGDIWWRKRSGGGPVGIVIKVNINGNIANITDKMNSLCAGQKVIVLNTLDDIPIYKRDINYQYYYNAACKIIDPIALGISPNTKPNNVRGTKSGKSIINKYRGMYNSLFDDCE